MECDIRGPTFSFRSASLTGRETAVEGAGVVIVVSGILGETVRKRDSMLVERER